MDLLWKRSMDSCVSSVRLPHESGPGGCSNGSHPGDCTSPIPPGSQFGDIAAPRPLPIPLSLLGSAAGSISMKIRQDSFLQPSHKVPVTFHDVAAYFSEEDWMTLHLWQKELYKNVMKEVHQALFSLGHNIINTNVLLRISKKGKACFRDPEKRVRANDPITPWSPVVQPDILFRIKQEEKIYCRDWYWSDEPAPINSLHKGGTVSNSKVLLNRKREANLCMKNRRHPCRKQSNDGLNRGKELVEGLEGFKGPYTFSLAKDSCSKASLMDQPRAGGEETITGPNPDLSLTIKQEVEAYPVDDQAMERKESLKNSAVDGSLNRERNTEFWGKCTEETLPCTAPSGNANLNVIRSSEKAAHSRAQQWSECNTEMSEEENSQCEGDLRNAALSGLHQESSKAGRFDSQNECESILMKAHHAKSPSNMQPNWVPFTFTECGKSFSENMGFINHQIAHAGGRSYQCIQCDKSFSQKVNLIRHQRTHTGERPYHCTECEKRFSHKHHLKGHQRTHTGEKPYQCAKCAKTFSWKESLSRHQRTHSGERPYQCSECKQTFSLKEGLIRHQRKHMRDIFNCSASEVRQEIPQSPPYIRNSKGPEIVKWKIEGEKELLFCY
ncbi:zinc finger protein 25-like isoform X2 [Ambystoma mexicanum]|uniref:zinc finger protein 25-like isoform X2 n=1 Tax=Ambystoma mexicanum TaxID=8296 RepID=UPI0037E83B5A